jgi:hypothetical protein
MNIRKNLLLAIALVAVSAAPSFAASTKGFYGLGYYRPEAPVGGRVWFTDKVAGDLGIGFDNISPDGGDSKSAFVIATRSSSSARASRTPRRRPRSRPTRTTRRRSSG